MACKTNVWEETVWHKCIMVEETYEDQLHWMTEVKSEREKNLYENIYKHQTAHHLLFQCYPFLQEHSGGKEITLNNPNWGCQKKWHVTSKPLSQHSPFLSSSCHCDPCPLPPQSSSATSFIPSVLLGNTLGSYTPNLSPSKILFFKHSPWLPPMFFQRHMFSPHLGLPITLLAPALLFPVF